MVRDLLSPDIMVVMDMGTGVVIEDTVIMARDLLSLDIMVVMDVAMDMVIVVGMDTGVKLQFYNNCS